MRIQKRKTMMKDYEDLGYRLAVIRNTCDMTQQFVAEALGLAGQQAVSDIEKRKQLTDSELVPFAELYQVTVAYIRTFNIEAMSKTVINIHDNKQAYGAHIQNNNVNPVEELLKQVEETKVVLREQIVFLKDIISSKDADTAALRARIEKLEALIVDKDEQINRLLTQLSEKK